MRPRSAHHALLLFDILHRDTASDAAVIDSALLSERIGPSTPPSKVGITCSAHHQCTSEWIITGRQRRIANQFESANLAGFMPKRALRPLINTVMTIRIRDRTVREAPLV